MFRFGWLHLLFSTLWLFNSIQNVSSITSEGFRVEHGSSPILGNYVFAQNIKNSKIIRDCHDLRQVEVYTTDGAYIINPTGLHPFMVYCKFEPRNAWTRIQQRADASVSFQRNWHDYKWGFGHPVYNYWIGLEHLYQMTHKQPYQMRVTLEYWNNTRVYASYSTFSVGTEQQQYRLKYDFLRGSAGDSLSDHHYLANFSTYDKDNDNRRYENCAITHAGGWWYNSCDRANLNGHYYYMGELKNIKFDNGIEWTTAAYHYSFQYASMMIAPNLELIQSQAQILQNQEQAQGQRTLTRSRGIDGRSLSGTGSVTQTGTGTRSGTITGTGIGGGTQTGRGIRGGTETDTSTEGGTPTGTGTEGGTPTGTGTGGGTHTGIGTGGGNQTGTATGGGTQTGTATGGGTQTGSQSQDGTRATEGQATGSQQQECIINEGGASSSRTEEGTETGGVGTGIGGTGNGGTEHGSSLVGIGIGRTNSGTETRGVGTGNGGTENGGTEHGGSLGIGIGRANSGTHGNREAGNRGSLLEINIGRRGSGTNNNNNNNNNRGSRGGLVGLGIG